MSNDLQQPRNSDLAYSMAYAGAIGSGLIAAFFLVLDAVAGQPLATPLLVGSALFTGALPPAGGALRLDLVAMYSIAHLGMFTAVGALFAALAARLSNAPGITAILSAGLFLTLTAGVFTLDALVAPDLVAAIGLSPVMLGNAVASGGMTVFYLRVFTTRAAWLPIPTTLLGDAD